MPVQIDREAPPEIRRILERLTPEEKAAVRERVLCAAVEWVYDQSCSHALAELEDAVVSMMGTPVSTGLPEGEDEA